MKYFLTRKLVTSIGVTNILLRKRRVHNSSGHGGNCDPHESILRSILNQNCKKSGQNYGHKSAPSCLRMSTTQNILHSPISMLLKRQVKQKKASSVKSTNVCRIVEIQIYGDKTIKCSNPRDHYSDPWKE